MPSIHVRYPATTFAATLASSLLAWTAYGDTEPTQVQLGSDVFASGDSVYLTDAVLGDVIAAGGTVRAEAAIHGDAVLAGSLVSLTAPVDGDLYAAGRRVELQAKVGGNARVVGAEIAVGPSAVIDGAVTAGGGTVEVNGTVNQYLQVLAGTTRLRGTVLGDVNVSGGELFIEPSANLAGEVSFQGAKPAIVAQGARLKSDVKYTPTQPNAAIDGGSWVALVLLGLGWWLGAAVLGIGFWQLWPDTASAVVAATRQQTLRAFGLGVAIAVAGLPLVVLLGLSVVGLPLALLALCAYVLLFPFGYITSCVAVAQLALTKTTTNWARRLGTTFAVLIAASAFAAAVPVLGPLCAFGMSMIGAGSLVLTWLQSIRQRTTPIAASNTNASTPTPTQATAV